MLFLLLLPIVMFWAAFMAIVFVARMLLEFGVLVWVWITEH
jgi:hypothetical protein